MQYRDEAENEDKEGDEGEEDEGGGGEGRRKKQKQEKEKEKKVEAMDEFGNCLLNILSQKTNETNTEQEPK
jgi:S-adenosylmethionine hydrolase